MESLRSVGPPSREVVDARLKNIMLAICTTRNSRDNDDDDCAFAQSFHPYRPVSLLPFFIEHEPTLKRYDYRKRDITRGNESEDTRTANVRVAILNIANLKRRNRISIVISGREVVRLQTRAAGTGKAAEIGLIAAIINSAPLVTS